MAEHFDLVVIGAGSAARHGAEMAAREYGARVALIERERWGGGCPNVACRPTKAYLVAAELMHDVRRHAAERGIDLPEPTIDLARTVAWKDSLRRSQDSWVELLEDQGYGVFSGQATFVDAHTVRVGDDELTGDRILIATGGRTAVPPIPGIEMIDWIDNISARPPRESGPRVTSPPGRGSLRPPSTRRASPSTTCSATAPGAPTTPSSPPRSSPT